jgi:hypothetical protein
VVAEEGTVIVWDCAPLSDQLAYTYWVPVPPACGVVVTATVWFDPGIHCSLHGAVQPLPSTLNANPGGDEVTVIVTLVPTNEGTSAFTKGLPRPVTKS